MNSPLQGGRMRRRRGAAGRVRALLLALFVASVALGVWLGAASGLSDPQPPPAAVVHARAAVRHERPEPVKPPRHVPPPGSQLIGAKRVRVRFKRPPRAG